MTLFDSLVHATADGSWLGTNRYDAGLNRLLDEMGRAGVARACLVAIADYVDNNTVARFAAEHPDRFVPVGSINPVSYATPSEAAAAVAHLKTEGFRGLKLHPRLNGYNPLDEKAISAVRAAGEEGLVLFLDTLFRQPAVATRHPADLIDELATRCPTTTIILLHGGGSALLQVADVVCAHPNLILDLSFTLIRYQGSSLDADIRYVLRTFDRRTIVGSDFPEMTPMQMLARFADFANDLTDEKRANVLHDNLAKLFG